ncbi:hypothetical protein LB452_05885 [Psychroflexus sp. CAK8W]|uniref:Uncharacterized protein n=1 Tax=Psychroflexus longus TaxID=2873596 RepID=A0ABS7XI87_9FLAO|nr:hypothetical protein [Psychroflexus longus]MBZ9778450.1 hypothetical protein [Psychroflexus longus]
MNGNDFTQYLLKTEKNEIRISFFKDYYNPNDLAEKLDSLVKTGLIEIDWERKLIIKKFNLERMLVSKNKLLKKEKEKPSYMKGEQTGINKPYI